MNIHNFQVKSEWQKTRAHNFSEEEEVEEEKEKQLS
jgi:hypothetical protein